MYMTDDGRLPLLNRYWESLTTPPELLFNRLTGYPIQRKLFKLGRGIRH